MKVSPRSILACLSLIPGLILAQTLHWNKGRGYAPFHHITPEGVLLSNTSGSPLLDSVGCPTPYTSARLSFRIDNRHATPRKNYRYITSDGKEHTRKDPPWALFLTDATGNTCWITVDKNPAPTDDLAEDTSGTSITIDTSNDTTIATSSDTTIDSPNDTTIEGSEPFHTVVKDRILPFSGETLWNLELTDGTLRVIAGAHEPTEIVTIPLSLNGLSSFGFAASPAAEILLSDITLTPLTPAPFTPNTPDIFAPATVPANALPADTVPSVGTRHVASAESSADPLVGTYEIFDRTLDESLLKLGGEYKLAVVKNHDRYDIIYISGARVNGNRWKPGMLKGILTPTSFDGIYNLEWFDAEGRSLSHSITAQSGYGGTLTLQFPYHSSTIRLRKTN